MTPDPESFPPSDPTRPIVRMLLPPVLFALVLAFYIVTLQPSLSWGDGTRLQREVITSESFILAELVDVDVEFAPDPYPFARLGVAAWDHPLYVIIGHGLVRLLPGVDPLWLVNLISAVCGAAAVTLLFQLCLRHTGSLIGALYAALALAVAHTFWFHASTPEVYTLFAFLLLLSLHLFDDYWRTGRQTALVATLFVFGLNMSNHILTGLALPAAVLTFLLIGGLKQKFRFKWSALWLPSLAFLAGFAPFLIQLARMLRTFPLNEVMGPVVGSTFLQGLTDTTPRLLLTSVLTYLAFLTFQFTPVGLGLGLYGLFKGRQAYPMLWAAGSAFWLIYTLFGILYRVSDQFAFFLAAYVFWAVLMAIGVARLSAAWTANRQRTVAAVLTLLIVIMPPFYGWIPQLAHSAGISDEAVGIPRVGNGVRDGINFYLNPNKRGDDDAYRFGLETMTSLPADAVVLAQWYTDTDEYFVLRYFATVDGLRPDITLLGWPREEPIDFDAAIALRAVEDYLAEGRPLYLASLSDAYYGASTLVERYCVVQETNLYRVYADVGEAGSAVCETEVQP